MSRKVGELAGPAAQREDSTAPFPGFSPGIEECWMDLDGARLRYLCTNPPFGELRAGFLAKEARSGAPTVLPGPALILLHGLLGYSFSWRYTMPALAPYATVYAPDMMGAGFSDRPAGIDHSMPGTAQRVLRFIAGLGISSFDLLGTSHGGAFAMFVAAECLRRNVGLNLRRLVLVAPVNPYSANGRRMAPFFGSLAGAALFRLTVARMSFLFPHWHARMYGDRNRIPPGTLEGYMAPLAKPGLFEHALGIVRTWTEDLRELETVLSRLASVPTLFMWGSKDTAVYASSAEPLRRFFPNSKLIIFPGVGHLPYEECPEEFNGALIEFLRKDELPARLAPSSY
ncbi:MAG: alpha/beta hydrolase [Candidatus Sulfotelmatobacter sp.]